MTYRELQQALKPYKAEGKTNIRLNSKKAVLQAEYDRLTSTLCAEINYCAQMTRELNEVGINSKKAHRTAAAFTRLAFNKGIDDNDRRLLMGAMFKLRQANCPLV